jgi:hypothetical protein
MSSAPSVFPTHSWYKLAPESFHVKLTVDPESVPPATGLVSAAGAGAAVANE